MYGFTLQGQLKYSGQMTVAPREQFNVNAYRCFNSPFAWKEVAPLNTLRSLYNRSKWFYFAV